MDEINCNFKIVRKTIKQKVISMSLWKGNIKYIFNLSNTLLWWGRNSKKLFPDWNIRLYIDNNITKPLESTKDRKQDIDWFKLFEKLKEYENIELWFYNCPWGQKSGMGKHINTFGSLVRFHAFQDKHVNVVLCKNIELLSSKKDAEIINNWVQSDKKYFTLYNIQTGYDCDYSNSKMCESVGLTDTNMILATFGIKKNHIDIFDKIHEIRNKFFKELKDFPYGIDEIVLTKIYKPLMNIENTFIVPRQLIQQSIPEDFKIIFEHIYDVLHEQDNKKADKSIFSEEQLKALKKYSDMLEQRYYYRGPRITIILSQLSQFYPDIAIVLLDFLREEYKYQDETEENYYNGLKILSHSFHFNLFKYSLLHEKKYEDDEDEYKEPYDEPENFFKEIENYLKYKNIKLERRQQLCTYFILTTYISDDTDWIGTDLKFKSEDIMPKVPIFDKIFNKLQKEKLNEINKSIKKNRENQLKEINKLLEKNVINTLENSNKNIEIKQSEISKIEKKYEEKLQSLESQKINFNSEETQKTIKKKAEEIYKKELKTFYKIKEIIVRKINYIYLS